MPASGFKIVLFFSNQKQGWSETYYNAATSTTDAFNAAGPLISARVVLLGEPAQCDAVRISSEENPRSSTLTPLAPLTSWPYSSRSDLPATAALARLYSGAQNRTRAVYLRGVPDGVFDLKDPTNADAQLFRANYNTWGGVMKASTPNFSIKYAPRQNAPGAKVIEDWVTTANSSNTKVTQVGATTLKVGDFIDVYKIRGLPFPPGRSRVVGVGAPLAAEEFLVRYRTPQDFVYGGGGFFILYDPNYDPITDFSVYRLVKRAIGRPTGASRGRRRSIAR